MKLVLCQTHPSFQGGFGWRGSDSFFLEPSSMTQSFEWSSATKSSIDPPLRRMQRGCRPAPTEDDSNVPSLVSIQKWSSSKVRPRESVSIATQVSMDRLPALENQCATWPDHLVAVVYLPFVANLSGGPPHLPSLHSTSLEEVIHGLQAFYNFLESTAACAFHLELVGQAMDRTSFPGSYPINSLRNRAMALSPTDLVIPLDSDFVVTPYLGLRREEYRNITIYDSIVANLTNNQAIILPALQLTNTGQDFTIARNVAQNLVRGKERIESCFSLSGRALCISDEKPTSSLSSSIPSSCAVGKEMAREALTAGLLAPHVPMEGVTVMDLEEATRWAQQSSSTLYSVSPQAYFEPCLVVSVANVPWFDERFVEFPGSAAPWYSHLVASDFSFTVHPYAFVVHVAHGGSSVSSPYVQAQRVRHMGQMELLLKRVEAEINAGGYEPVTKGCEINRNAGMYIGSADKINSSRHGA